jgi:hypothetical protein
MAKNDAAAREDKRLSMVSEAVTASMIIIQCRGNKRLLMVSEAAIASMIIICQYDHNSIAVSGYG